MGRWAVQFHQHLHLGTARLATHDRLVGQPQDALGLAVPRRDIESRQGRLLVPEPEGAHEMSDERAGIAGRSLECDAAQLPLFVEELGQRSGQIVGARSRHERHAETGKAVVEEARRDRPARHDLLGRPPEVEHAGNRNRRG